MGNFCFTFALLCCQYSLWFGKGSVGHTEELQDQLVRQEEKNQTLTLRNNFLNAEVEDLAHGQEAIAEIAASNWAMSKTAKCITESSTAAKPCKTKAV